MPRESTRPFVSGDHAPQHPDGLQIRIEQNERTVRVALSGILDREGVDRLVSRVAPRLVSRGCRVILEGSRLTHLDYRATRGLIAWNRRLRAFGHQLFLQEWSDYLKAILVMEDWDRELGSTPSEAAALRLLGRPVPVGRT
ncbi:STAS domain-containing protein [bacterium]|nr:STAS domain-containing protein [bacterium]